MNLDRLDMALDPRAISRYTSSILIGQFLNREYSSSRIDMLIVYYHFILESF